MFHSRCLLSGVVMVWLYLLPMAQAARIGYVSPRIKGSKAGSIAIELKAVGVGAKDVTAAARRGALPLDELDILILDAYALSDAKVRTGLTGQKAAIEQYILNGGTIIEFGQDFKVDPKVLWLPQGFAVERSPVNHGPVPILRPDHRLVKGFNLIKRTIRVHDVEEFWLLGGTGWRTEGGSLKPGEGFEVILAEDSSARYATLMVGAAGQGRMLFCAYAPGLARYYKKDMPRRFLDGREGARLHKLLKNLIDYAGDVRAGRVGEFKQTKRPWTRISLTGVVFDDADGNGKRDKGEAGIPGVAVGNGEATRLTDKEGRYALTALADKHAFITVSTPRGRVAHSGKFFHRVSFAGATPFEQVADFPLIAAPERDKEEFTFIHASDPWIGRGTLGNCSRFFSDVGRLATPPAFVAITGNLAARPITNRAQFGTFRRIAADLRLPLYCAAGDRDASAGSRATGVYEQMVGPVRYSFNVGAIHFVVLNQWESFASPAEGELVWLKGDLAAAGKDKAVVVLQHAPPSSAFLKLIAGEGGIAVFSGGELMGRMRTREGVLDASVGPVAMSGVDGSPPGYRAVTVRGRAIDSLPTRHSQIGEHLVCVAPSDNATMPLTAGGMEILAMAYGAPVRPKRITYTITGKVDGFNKIEGVLAPKGEWTWSAWATIPMMEDAGELTLTLTAHLDDDSTATRTVVFRVASVDAPRPKPGGDWLMVGKDARHSASTPKLKPPLRLLWRRQIPGRIIGGGPIIGSSRVYVGTTAGRRADEAGIACIDLESGALIWRKATGGDIPHSLARSGDRLYAATTDGRLLTLNAANGESEGRLRLSADGWYNSAPVAADSVVYVGSGAFFAAVKEDGGEILWSKSWRKWADGAAYPGATSVHAGRVIVPTAQGMRCLTTDGEKGWFLPRHRVNVAALRDKVLLTGTTSACIAVDVESGKELWSARRVYSLMRTGAAFAGEQIVVPHLGLRTLKAATGKTMRSYVCHPRAKAIVGSLPLYSARRHPTAFGMPVISGNVAYVGSSDGYLSAVDLASRKLLWSRNLGLPLAASMAASGNLLIVADWDGNVYAFAGAEEEQK
jgi:outer membrane protein assembly factor BamB